MAEQAGANTNEVVITPEMIRAGRDALGFADIENAPGDAVVEVYRVMERVRERASQRSGNDGEPRPEDR